MATYNKRGYKSPKEKEEKLDGNFIEDVKVDEKDSTTAGVFNSLDQTASKTEEWVARNQKYIFGIVLAAIARCDCWLFIVPKIHCSSERR